MLDLVQTNLYTAEAQYFDTWEGLNSPVSISLGS